MNISELVDILVRYPLDTRVIVDGYEGGFSDVKPEEIKIINIKLDGMIVRDWFGPHSKYVGQQNDPDVIPALCIGRDH